MLVERACLNLTDSVISQGHIHLRILEWIVLWLLDLEKVLYKFDLMNKTEFLSYALHRLRTKQSLA
jgi:hypothetical protein